jgi:hypothetical protein
MTCSSVFKADAEKGQVKVHEILILELEKAPENEGLYGMRVVQVKAYLDPAPVQAKAESLMDKVKW